MSHRIELFYDIVSPYSYLAATCLVRYRRHWDLEIVWRPAFLGGLMAAVGNAPPASLPQRAPYLARDIGRLGRFFEVELTAPDDFPGNTLKVMRLIFAAQQAHPERLEELSFALWRHHWGLGHDVKNDDGLVAVCDALGLPGRALLARATEQSVKDALRAATDEAAERGAFGFPAYFVEIDGETEMYFGCDRIELMGHDLGKPWLGPSPK